MEVRSRSLLILLVVSALLFFTRLDLPLLEPQEARYAEIPRQMMHQGSWLTPMLHGQPYLDKPPLLYWSVMASYALFGAHDWAARLVPGLSCLFTVLIVYLWGRRIAGERAGLAGALVLCLSARYVYLGRMLTFDTLLCLWVTGSFAAAHIHLRERGRLAWMLSALLCGLGVLTKGPVALVLVAVPILVLPFLDPTAQRPRVYDWLVYLLTVVVVAGPWFLCVAQTHPDFLRSFFWQHHVVRFVEPFDHAEPFWFHLPGVLLGMLPWTLLLPGLVGRGFDSRFAFCLLAAGWGLLFFSLSGCKRAVYILPALPPLALALGMHLAELSAATRERWKWCATATCAILFIALLFGGPWYHERFGLRSCVESCGADADVVVICYPRSWDSVSFYLGRDDVRIFSEAQRGQLLEQVKSSPRTLLFVKAGKTADELLRLLPEQLVFTPQQQTGSVLVGWITRPLPFPRSGGEGRKSRMEAGSTEAALTESHPQRDRR